ncbi:MAG: hypothetical protein WB586_24745 [Chthoniobacterales bacterium]
MRTGTSTMVRSARRVEFTDIQFEPRNGKVRLVYDIDGLVFNVHGIFHDAPELSDRIWEVCLGELGLACLVDVATASMARTCLSRAYNPDVKGHEAFTEATRALRLELIADHGLSKRLLSLACTWGATVSRLGVVPDTDDNRVLLLMGGGKDSLYAYELLRKCGYDVHCFYLTEARRSWQQLRRVYAAFRDEVPHHRAFLDVNRRGIIEHQFGAGYRSQFQIGQLLASAMPYALGNKCRYIAMGLERSSDDPMLCYKGLEVNHQHQKSSSFLAIVNRHLKERYHGAVQIVSPIHGLYDFGIYARFLRLKMRIVLLQSSCGGSNFRNPHCGKCEKCAFLAALFAGLGGDRRIYKVIYPRDPLSNPDAFQPWLEECAPRPMTCAGHIEEFRLALYLAKERGWRSQATRALGDNFGARHIRFLVQHYLKVHPSKLMPQSMQLRVSSVLREEGKRAEQGVTGVLQSRIG